MNTSYKSYIDEELVALIRSDNQVDCEGAFTEVYNRYSSKVHAYCLRVIGNETSAEDIFQETFIKFYKKVRIIKDKTNVPGFLITIARNLCLNYKRDNRPSISIDDVENLFHTKQSYEDIELLELITTAVDLLDFEFKEAFVLKEYNGFSYTEIAEITGSTVTNAKTRVFRAKKKIKQILLPYLRDFA